MLSERNAWLCTHKDCIPPVRIFAAPGAEPGCPEHGKRAMVHQPNVPYMDGPKTGKPKRVRPRRPERS